MIEIAAEVTRSTRRVVAGLAAGGPGWSHTQAILGRAIAFRQRGLAATPRSPTQPSG